MVNLSFSSEKIKSSSKKGEEILFLGFLASDQSYAFHINFVKEILKIPKIFSLPETPAFLKGVIDLRGAIIPVLDIKERFSLGSVHPKKGRIIVVNLAGQLLGVLVDKVNEVFAVEPKEIKPTPLMLHKEIIPFIEGMVLFKDNLYYIMNPKNLLSQKELKILESQFSRTEEG